MSVTLFPINSGHGKQPYSHIITYIAPQNYYLGRVNGRPNPNSPSKCSCATIKIVLEIQCNAIDIVLQGGFPMVMIS